MKKTKDPENRAYKVTLIVLVGLAAFSTAMKDLNRLRETVSSVQEFTSQWRGNDLEALNEKTISTPVSITALCPNESLGLINSFAESGASDNIAPATDIEIENIDYETITEPEVGGKVELLASRKTNRDVPQLARAKYALARTLKEEISAKRRHGHWPAHIEFRTNDRIVEFRTNDRIVTVDLPMTMMTDIKADDFEAEASPDFPLSLLGRTNRKQSHGKTDNGRREFIIKRFERNFSSRRAS